jgi:hypothetical protein
MKSIYLKITILGALFTMLSMRNADDWTPLLDKDLSQWETYLSYSHKVGYDGKVPKDSAGNPIPPIGYNNDKNHVFSVINDAEGPILHISGETYGAIFTHKEYKNYDLKLQGCTK